MKNKSVHAHALAQDGEGIFFLSDTDFGAVGQMLEESPSPDAYVRSDLYYALTGRGRLWGIKHRDVFILCAQHPNLKNALLVFFPFAQNLMDYREQIESLLLHTDFLNDYMHIFLARIPQRIHDDLFFLEQNSSWSVRRHEENILDWAYPSYDVSLDRLVQRDGHDLAVYRKKSRKYNDRDVEVIPLQHMSPAGIKQAIIDINVRWVSHKLLSPCGEKISKKNDIAIGKGKTRKCSTICAPT